ncbi:MAG: TIGR02391 family protein, partial [Armatimonadia bacterium]
MPLVEGGHYSHAARQAMILVEEELKRKSGASRQYGQRLAQKAFGGATPLQLRVALGEDAQKDASKFLEGAFGYYRNHVMHTSADIGQTKCMMILMIATELMELIGASRLAFHGMETLQQLLDCGKVSDATQLRRLLEYLDQNTTPDEAFDGLWEDLASMSMGEEHLELVADLGLVEWTRDLPGPEWPLNDPFRPDFLDTVELTADGQEMLRLCRV